ncbi:MAG: type IV pilus secretin PilQ [Elusimicrobia bacterium]|nr:type IV pilus secretin PilQ [Elusimicrobiota bacterium]
MKTLSECIRRATALLLAAALVAPTPALAQQAEKALLEGVEAGSDRVSIHLSRPAQFNAFTTAEPPRLVVELLNTEFEGASQVVEGKGRFLDKVRSGQYQREPSPIARVVLYLKELVSYRARWEGPRLDVELQSQVSAPAPAAAPAVEKVVDAPAEAAAAPAPSAAARIESIDAGADAAAIALSRETPFTVTSTAKPPRLIFEFTGAELPGGAKQAAGQGEWLRRARAVQFKPAPTPVARVVLDLKAVVGYRARWEGTTLKVTLQGPVPVETAAATAAVPAKPALPGVPAPKPAPVPAPAPAAEPAHIPAAPVVQAAPAAKPEYPAPALMVVSNEKPAAPSAGLPKTMSTDASPELSAMAGAGSPASPSAGASAGGPPASGRLRRDILATLPRDPITLEFDNMDVHDILTLLSQKAGVNIVYGSDVTGSLSLQLRDVPFNEAFLTVLSMKGLVANQVGENILRVLTPASLKSERAVSVNQTRVIRLKYSKAEDVSASVSAVASAEGRTGQFVVDANSNSLIITDTLEGIAAAERLLSELDIRPQQVQIEAKLVEVQLSKDLAMGIQWDYAGSEPAKVAGQAGTNIYGGVKTPQATASPILNPIDKNANALIGDGAASGRGTGVFLPAAKSFGAFTFGRVTNNYFLSATLTAAASQGKAKVLSDPKVTTLNGKEAKINITTKIPFVTTETTPSAGTITTTQKVEFQETGITLTVKPTINADGRITVEVKPAVRQPSAVAAAAGTTVAISVDSRDAQTTVIVQDGGTVVIGGLITDSAQETVAKVPLLGDIPLLGYLFRKKFVSRTRVELLIFVTTKIIPS